MYLRLIPFLLAALMPQFSLAEYAEPLAFEHVAMNPGAIDPLSTTLQASAHIEVLTNVPSTGTLTIRSEEGVEVYAAVFENSADQIWDGRDTHGALVPDGVYTLTVTASDGTTSVEHSETIVIDTQAPVITLIGENPARIQFGTRWSEPGATSPDGRVQISGQVVSSQVGSNELSYLIYDAVGHRTEIARIVHVDPIPVELTVANLTHTYDGHPKSVSVHPNYPVQTEVLYDGSSALPKEIGTYTVTAFATQKGYVGTTTGTMTIHAGSVQTAPQTSTSVRTEVEKYVVLPAGLQNATDLLSEISSTPMNIEELQRVLIRTGHLAIPAPTGIFGPLTHTALRFYQLANGLPQTGFADTDTLASLEQADEATVMTELAGILRKVEELFRRVEEK